MGQCAGKLNGLRRYVAGEDRRRVCSASEDEKIYAHSKMGFGSHRGRTHESGEGGDVTVCFDYGEITDRHRAVLEVEEEAHDDG